MDIKDPDYIFAHKIYVAIEEYDKLGADDFKTEYGYGKAYPAGEYRAIVTAECIAN